MEGKRERCRRTGEKRPQKKKTGIYMAKRKWRALASRKTQENLKRPEKKTRSDGYSSKKEMKRERFGTRGGEMEFAGKSRLWRVFSLGGGDAIRGRKKGGESHPGVRQNGGLACLGLGEEKGGGVGGELKRVVVHAAVAKEGFWGLQKKNSSSGGGLLDLTSGGEGGRSGYSKEGKKGQLRESSRLLHPSSGLIH